MPKLKQPPAGIQAETASIWLAAIVESSDDAIIGKDLNGVITSWNKGAEVIFGYNAGEMEGTSIMRLIPADRQDEETLILERIKRGERVEHFETVRLTKEGRLIEMSVTASPIQDATGKIIGVSKVARDITERKRAEMALQERTVELEDKSAELERFVYALSHDLKSPVLTIETFLTYLEQDLAAADSAKVGKDLRFLHTAADKMGRLLEALVEMARVGCTIGPAADITFRTLVDDALGAVAGRIAKQGVTVKVDDFALTLRGDPLRLSRIWQNLVENACKFMGSQKEPRIEIGVEVTNEETVFFVRDNGIGIDPRHKSKLFGLFEKLDPEAEGTGIGLALVKRIVEDNRGRVWVESAGPGHGSKFLFTLPKAVHATI